MQIGHLFHDIPNIVACGDDWSAETDILSVVLSVPPELCHSPRADPKQNTDATKNHGILNHTLNQSVSILLGLGGKLLNWFPIDMDERKSQYDEQEIDKGM